MQRKFIAISDENLRAVRQQLALENRACNVTVVKTPSEGMINLAFLIDGL